MNNFTKDMSTKSQTMVIPTGFPEYFKYLEILSYPKTFPQPIRYLKYLTVLGRIMSPKNAPVIISQSYAHSTHGKVCRVYN